jgi:hypothetical protein
MELEGEIMSGYFDHETNTIFFADCLRERYPSVFWEASVFLIANGITVKTIKYTKNIWCRDYMPIQVGDHFVKFRYADSNFKHRKPPIPSCYRQFDPIISDILLDGGNIMRCGYKAFITEKVKWDNPGLKVSKLEELLETEVVLIPVEPYDDLGHSDGILNFTPQGTLIINDYLAMKKEYWHRYHDKLVSRLNGWSIRHLPNLFEKIPKITEKQFRKKFPFSDDFNPGWGYYMNFLQVKDIILLPKFNIIEDIFVLHRIKELFPTFKVKQIDCSELSMEGGLVHCTTVNYRL